MNNYHSIFRKILWRVLPAALLIIWGWVEIGTSFGVFSQLLVGLLLCFLGILIIAPPLSELAAEMFSFIYNPTAPPEQNVLTGEEAKKSYEKRFAELYEISVREAQRVDVYIEMIDIAFNEFKDGNRALSVLYKGLKVLQKKEDREAMSDAFNKAKAGIRLKIV
ncbi:MAG: hypothetical protein EPN22_08910 [Nitrospirae bacterium]|nr:MAG: hypothetical protein EPN22_08910 [Nitrospirota bacterium]